MVKTKIEKTYDASQITIEEAKRKIAELQKIIDKKREEENSEYNKSFQILYKEVENDLKEYVALSEKKLNISFECLEQYELIFHIGYCDLEYDWYSETKYKNKKDAKIIEALAESSSESVPAIIKNIPEVKKFLSVVNAVKKRIRDKINKYTKECDLYNSDSKIQQAHIDDLFRQAHIDDLFHELLNEFEQ